MKFCLKTNLNETFSKNRKRYIIGIEKSDNPETHFLPHLSPSLFPLLFLLSSPLFLLFFSFLFLLLPDLSLSGQLTADVEPRPPDVAQHRPAAAQPLRSQPAGLCSSRATQPSKLRDATQPHTQQAACVHQLGQRGQPKLDLA